MRKLWGTCTTTQLCLLAAWNAGSKSGATHFSGNGGGGIFEAVGDSIIDLGGVKTQEAAAAKGRRRRRRTEEETPLNFLVLFFKSDKWLAKMSEYYYSSCSHFAMPFLLWLLIVILATRKVYSARRRGNILL